MSRLRRIKTDGASWFRRWVSETSATRAPSDDELAEWVASSPEAIRAETTTFVDVTTVMRRTISEADPQDLRQVTREGLAALFENPEFDSSGRAIEAFAVENCPDFTG